MSKTGEVYTGFLIHFFYVWKALTFLKSFYLNFLFLEFFHKIGGLLSLEVGNELNNCYILKTEVHLCFGVKPVFLGSFLNYLFYWYFLEPVTYFWLPGGVLANLELLPKADASSLVWDGGGVLAKLGLPPKTDSSVACSGVSTVSVGRLLLPAVGGA